MRRHQVTNVILVCCWLVTIFYLSSLPSLDFDINFGARDKLFHMLAYGLLGVFLLGVMRPTVTGYSLNQVGLATLIATLYGITDEWHQAYVPGRTSDPLDVVADCLGALLATLAARALMRSRLVQQFRG